MNPNKTLESIARSFAGKTFGSISWGDIWDRKLENGTGFEWAVFFSILEAAKREGYTVDFPLLSTPIGKECFVLRNVIPSTYGSQAGHSAFSQERVPLRDKFYACLVPKAVLVSPSGETFSVFREGCPYHQIATGKHYLDRTDIIVFPGTPLDGTPVFVSESTLIHFAYSSCGKTFEGLIRPEDSPMIPCVQRRPAKNQPFQATGIVEISVNKKLEVAEEQINRYQSLFNDEKVPPVSLITGNLITGIPVDAHRVDLSLCEEQLKAALLEAAKGVLINFGLIAQ